MLTLDKYPNVNRQIERCIIPEPLYALNFDGVNDSLIGTGITKWDYTQPFTMFAKIKDFDPANPNTSGIIDMRETVNGRGLIFSEGNSFYQFNMANQSPGNRLVVRFGTGTDGNGHIIQVTNDGSGTGAGLTCYVDGVAQAKTVVDSPVTATIIAGNQVTIGGNNPGFGGVQPFTGTIEEVSFVDYEKNSTEITSDFNEGTQSAGSGSFLMCIRPLYDGTTNRGIQSLDSTNDVRGCAGLGYDYAFNGYPNPLVLDTNLICVENC